ncbi:MAG TPA: hypothetical protein VKB50_13410 [Vicinamibacterales bacterium]|nr:hypothetical protein [Vicinamibacterales bacterium]
MSTEMMFPWATLIALGAFHGINPGMGWLFAVALGMQEQRRRAVLRALVPLGAGHALAVAGAVGVALGIGFVIPLGWLRWPIAVVLVALGVRRLFRHGHPRWGGMRVSMPGLTVWSFLMATAHGAGLMVVPVFMGMSMAGAEEHAHHLHHMQAAGISAGAAFFATGLHAVGYLVVTAFVAVLVFEKVGVGILRRAWFNLDLIWSAALIVTGTLTLML